MIFDPLYLLFVGPAMLLAVVAQMMVKSAYASAQTQPAALSGSAAARMILDSNGLQHVRIEMSQGFLSDHYDPKNKVLRLSPDVYQTRSLAAVGIAAHEAGHAIQDGQQYAPLVWRNAIVPLAATGSRFAMGVFFMGMMLSMILPVLGQWVVLAAIALFSVGVVFQLVNLPVEFDASRRAKLILANSGIVNADQGRVVARVLNAAAMTYVAATASAIMTLVWLLIRSGVLRGDRR